MSQADDMPLDVLADRMKELESKYPWLRQATEIVESMLEINASGCWEPGTLTRVVEIEPGAVFEPGDPVYINENGRAITRGSPLTFQANPTPR